MRGKKRIFTAEEKALIMQDYNNREIKAADVRKKWGLDPRQMTALIEEMGGEFRVPNNHKPRKPVKSNVKVCPHCHRKIDIAGAKFCPFCATDIRSEKDVLREKVQRLYSMTSNLPLSTKDTAQEIIGEMLAYLRKD